jgi:hypothetical protein
MKRQISWLFVAVAVAVAPQLFATCPTAPTRHYIFPYTYDNYTPDTSCVSTSGSASATTLWCYSEPAWAIGALPAAISYEFTALDTPLFWDADVMVEFDDPTNSATNYFEAWAFVYDPSTSTTTATLLYSWNGTQGDISCQRVGNSFSAASGDTIEIVVMAQKGSSGATIEISKPFIYAYY